jgi:hypothetical protein
VAVITLVIARIALYDHHDCKFEKEEGKQEEGFPGMPKKMSCCTWN